MYPLPAPHGASKLVGNLPPWPYHSSWSSWISRSSSSRSWTLSRPSPVLQFSGFDSQSIWRLIPADNTCAKFAKYYRAPLLSMTPVPISKSCIVLKFQIKAIKARFWRIDWQGGCAPKDLSTTCVLLSKNWVLPTADQISPFTMTN